MKFSHFFIMAVGIATISSCSIISPKKNTVSGAAANPVKTENNNTTTPEPSNEIASIDGEWTIVSAAGKAIPVNDDMPYVTFENKTGKFYASDGCNIINGYYSLADNGKLSLSNVLSTMKMCHESDYGTIVSQALSGASPITVKTNTVGHESYIYFYNAKGNEIMSARKHNMDFLNGNWQITAVNGTTINNDEITIFIDINELKVHGNAGCNFFNGSIYINPDKSNAIDFSNLASTRMTCPDIAQESAILLALEETASAIQGSEGNVMLLNSSGKELLTLHPIAVREEE